jgi:hypothetical protein
MRAIPWRPAPATVIASVALGVALSGTSYAAFVLPANSVGSKQLKENAVVSSKVKDQSLFARDFRRGQLPRGAPGVQGPAGPQGPQGSQGPKGDTGAPDTSNFYDKAASDSRFVGITATAADAAKLGGIAASDYSTSAQNAATFLGLHATADDSAKLGGTPAASYVSGAHGGTLFQDVRTVPVNGGVELLPIPGHTLWALHSVCTTGPTPGVGLRNGSGETLDLFFTVNGGSPTHAVVPPGPGTVLFGTGLITLHGAFANSDTLTITVGSYATLTDCHFITQGMIAKSS